MTSVTHSPLRPLDPDGVGLFEAIVATVREPLLALDSHLDIRLANRAFHEFFGAAADRVEGANLFEIGDGLWDIPPLLALLEQVVSSRTPFEDYAVEAMRPGVGTRSLLLNARLLDMDGHAFILLALEDVTERDGLERLVSERTAELEAFNYSVSHDLRAPLRALNGFSRALIEDCSDELSDEGQRYLGLIRSNANQMGALIDGLLAFSRLGRQGMVRGPVDVRRVVGEVVRELEPELEDRTVEIVLGDLPPVDADPVLLRQVYANLIGNALKFTRGTASARIEVGSRIVGGERVWSVGDNGVGFDMAFAGKLFQTFQRLHRSDDYEGTGIGLALVRLIVQRHGGEISADAVEGRGATFSFTLPEERE
ncbi:MAG: PAS domain-containing protein [Actinobacteria bacterium]|nr:PAS domain-containing protein [Actinomycetota bacterium]